MNDKIHILLIGKKLQVTGIPTWASIIHEYHVNIATIVLTIIGNLFVLCVFAQNGNIEIDTIYTNEDEAKRIVLINKDISELNALFPEEKNRIQSGNRQYTFLTSVEEFEYGRAYEVTDPGEREFDLYFTQLPIITIVTNDNIVDEPRVYAQFSLCESNGNYTACGIGIEYRGGWSQTLPKKSYRIEFWADKAGNVKKDFSLLGMRNDDDWLIQAMYNEPLRLRSKANFELWRKIDTLYYQNDEPEAINGVRQQYVELFLNNQYNGVYTLSERPDRKQFKLKKYKNSEIRGELYKGVDWGGASTYTSLPPYDNNSELWAGFKYKYPDEVIRWDIIYEFINFVVHEDDAVFYESYHEKFNIDNAVNYFIFLNLLRATDNTGKNLFLTKYEAGHPYFFIPWDLDGTFGIVWNGEQENITNDILTNGFYERLLKDNLFTEKLTKRWIELRQDLLTVNAIMSVFNSQLNYLKSNGVYERESIAWYDRESLNFENMEYTTNWLTKRLGYLDRVFNNPELSIGGVKHNASKQNQVQIYPNPASHYLNLVPENNFTIEKVQIINASGEVLCVFLNNKISKSIDISGFSNGLYFIVIDSRFGKRVTKKIIVER